MCKKLTSVSISVVSGIFNHASLISGIFNHASFISVLSCFPLSEVWSVLIDTTLP